MLVTTRSLSGICQKAFTFTIQEHFPLINILVGYYTFIADFPLLDFWNLGFVSLELLDPFLDFLLDRCFQVAGCIGWLTILVLLKIVIIGSHFSNSQFFFFALQRNVFLDHLRGISCCQDSQFSRTCSYLGFFPGYFEFIWLLPITLFCWKDFLVAGCFDHAFATLLRRFKEGNVHVFLHARNHVVSFLSIFFSLSFASWIIIFLMRSFFQKLGVLPQRW